MDTPKRLTKGHLEVHEIVVYCGFDVDDEVEFPPYTVDIYVPELHVAVEYDGPMHDGYGQKKKDRIRDQYLIEEYGLPVLRINHKDLGSVDTVAHIYSWLEENGTEVDRRKQIALGFTGWQTT